jgi:hypothetical protein
MRTTTIERSQSNAIDVPRARVAVANSGDRFVRGGETWFPLFDTLWSAFTHVPDDEWERYLDQRAGQGFNAVNISVLPILHDLSAVEGAIPEPFPGLWEGRPRFGALADTYVARARRMLAQAVDHGLVPALVVLWCNYVPDTWASARDPRFVMNESERREFVASVVHAFDDFNPLYIVAGDADLRSASSRGAWLVALDQLRELVPDAVTAFHTQDTTVLDAELAAAPGMGFYAYQSGHQRQYQRFAWEYAEHYRAVTLRPVVNLEPCYEGHGLGFEHGRWDAADVRRASWQSLLAGASAGLGYGAHGVWGWHRHNATFNHVDFSGVPFDRWTAMGFPGADDVAFAASLMRQLGLVGAAPRQDLLRDPQPEVRAAVSTDGEHAAVYVPYAADVPLADGPVSKVRAWNLGAREEQAAEIIDSADGPVLRQPEWNADSLFLLTLGGTR